MSTELKCLKNSDTKAYIIPTNEWLQPIKPLLTQSSDAHNIIAKMLNKENILVRLTNNNNKRLPLINKKLSKLPNFPLIYCTIICKESSDIIDANYIINGKPAKGFCNGKSSDGYITLELMKYYKNNLVGVLLNTHIDIAYLRYILDQAISSQLLAFYHYGFVHNDIHINNFIIEGLSETHSYNYEFPKKIGFKNITGKVNLKVYVIDFGVAELLNPKYRSEYIDDYYIDTGYPSIPKLTNPKYINLENTLPNNIYETIKAFLQLSPNHEVNVDKIRNMQTQSNQTLDFYNYQYNKYYKTMCNSTNDFDVFVSKTLALTIRMVNEYYMTLFNEPFAKVDL